MSDQLTSAASSARTRAQVQVRAARSRRPVVDHAFRAQDRYSEVLGTQLAGSITYYGFLSFFPLMALIYSIVGYLTAYYPGVEEAVTDAIEAAFPGLIGDGPNQIDISDFSAARRTAGIIGILGLIYAGLGWLDSTRDGFRRVFGTMDYRPGFAKKKTIDVAVLALLGVGLLLSLVVSSLATSATTQALDLAGLGGSQVSVWSLKALSVAFALATDVLIVAILISRLSGAQLPWRRVRSGALLGAIGFEILKLVGTYLVSKTTTNPIYAAFGVIVGLLIWMNFLSRLLIYAAAWTATQPYSLEPGGRGAPGAGRHTGLAAATEPVTVVAPRDFDLARAPAGYPQPRASGWSLVLGAAAGAALGSLVSRARTRRQLAACRRGVSPPKPPP